MNKPLLLGLGWGGSVMLLQCILKHCCGNGFILHDPRVIENRWSQQWWLHTDLDSKIFMREWQLRFAICHLGCQKIFHPVHRMWQAKSISVQSLVMPYIKTHQYIQMMGILCKKHLSLRGIFSETMLASFPWAQYSMAQNDWFLTNKVLPERKALMKWSFRFSMTACDYLWTFHTYLITPRAYW